MKTNYNKIKKSNQQLLVIIAAVLFSCCGISNYATAQSMGISSSAITPDASSILELRSTSKGLLIPRMTLAQRGTITTSATATGVMIYQTDNTPGFYYYNGSAWVSLGGGTFVGNLAGDVTGPQASTVIASGVIVDSKIASGANIADSKLATISSAGKVANSATTATNSNNTLTIVSRDNGGNFSAGTITAALAGNATTATTATTATNLASGVTGSIPYQQFSGITQMLSPGTSGQILQTQGSGQIPIWVTPVISSTPVTTFSAGSTGFTPTTATSGAIVLSGTLGTANGGTNSTATPTPGGVGYGTNTAHAYSIAGTVGQALISNAANAPSFGTLPVVGGGTGGTTFSGVIHGNNTNAFTASNVSLTSEVTGTLPIANGGTNSTASPTQGAVAYGTGSAMGYNTAGTAGQALISAGASAPSFGTLSVIGGGTGVTTLTGLVKGNGVNAFTAATAGTDYVIPSGSITGNAANLTGLTTTVATLNSLVTNATHTGDATGATALTLATVNGNIGSFGTSTSVPTFTVNGKGLITAASATAIPTANTTTTGLLTSTDWNTFNGKGSGSGTVTNVAALTLGTTGTDLSSTVATGTTTPVITLQVPTASASNRGALSSTDWSTFNGKASTASPTFTGTPAAPTATASTNTTQIATTAFVTTANATNANLTGAVTSVGNATSLGSFTSSNLTGALTDETGTGVAVFATSPTLVTPTIGVATGTSLATSGAITSSSPSAGIGYAAGAGGTVTQITSKTTGVTINKTTGTITTTADKMSAYAAIKITVTNSSVGANDIPVVAIKSGGTSGAYLITVGAVAAGSFDIIIYNLTSGNGNSLSEALVISFAIIKGANN